jgi:hypothetical protein
MRVKDDTQDMSRGNKRNVDSRRVKKRIGNFSQLIRKTKEKKFSFRRILEKKFGRYP